MREEKAGSLAVVLVAPDFSQASQAAACRGNCWTLEPLPLQPFCGTAPLAKLSIMSTGSGD
jgi:hypothetical protein